MSTRYVWNKYNANTKQTVGYYGSLTSTSAVGLVTLYYSSTVTVSGGTVTLNSPTPVSPDYYGQINVPAGVYIMLRVYSGPVSSLFYSPFQNRYSTGEYAGTGAQYSAIGDIYPCRINTTYEKGTLIGYISSGSNTKYPQNGVSGAYWYTYVGEDSIDPSGLTYSTNSPKGGQTISVNLSPSVENSYGGTIRYQYSYSVDGGGSWVDIESYTTSASINVTIPKGSTSFQARVVAKDNYGFTSTTYVFGDSVTVTNNVAPSTPGAITLPATVFGGKQFTISWGSSTDDDGNLSGYELYRSVNEGTSWELVYKGPLTQAEDTVSFGTSLVQYRVRAYDTDSEYSSYRSSASKDIINNYDPLPPDSITVPDLIGDSSALIVWESSEDPDSNLSGYVLERLVDDGSFTQVYKGSATSFSDNISNSWNTVQYRVKAYDTYNFESSYTTSEVKSVIHNKPPVISGEDTDLGILESFSYEYTVTEVDEGQTLTVVESLDGSVIRTYNPVSGGTNTFTISKEKFLSLDPKSVHTASISASDGEVTVYRTLTFSRSVSSMSVELVPPFEADAMVTRMYCFVTGNFPTGCIFRFLASNNPFDEEPVWQDVTSEVKMREKFYFTNSSKTGDKWGVSIKLEVERNEVPEDTKIFVYKLEGGYDGRGASE